MDEIEHMGNYIAYANNMYNHDSYDNIMFY